MICLNRCRKQTLAFVIGALITAAGVYIAVQATLPKEDAGKLDAKDIPRQAIETLFATRLADGQGNPVRIGDWRDRTLVVNFWAAWCKPCRDEMPAFSRLYTQYRDHGVQFIGIAVDNAKNVADFSAKLPVSYPLLIAEAEGSQLMRDLGNTSMGLPYTLVIRPGGEAALTQLGRLSEQRLDSFLAMETKANPARVSGQASSN